jgi:two-component system OmpR family sensor kinase
MTATAPPAAKTLTTETTDGAPEERPLLGHTLLRRATRGLRWVPTSLRTRILAWFIGVLALATIASVVVTYEVLLLRLDQEIDAELTQEAMELTNLASGNDPETGRPFGTDVRRIFETYLQENVPGPNEAHITFVDGRPFLRSAQFVPYRLDDDPELVARWASIDEPDRGSADTPAGRVEYLALPLRAGGDAVGVFVAAFFVEGAKADADAAVRAAGAVVLAFLILGSIVAWRLADKVVRPVTALTQTARSISETELTARIPVRGDDEVAQLATTFNAMLDRLEHAFSAQRRFVDDAGHELKTPLTIVRGHLELLDLLDEDSEERRATLAIVMDELDRMGRIVGDLLLLAKHPQPDFLDLSIVDVGALTDEIYAKAKALAPRNWALEDRGQGSIVADRQRLTQAIVQLAHNAASYGGANGEPILLGSRIVDGEARFWVRDSGPGIPPEERELIFERFRRGSSPGRTEGAGLGLAIVKAIAEGHRGRVELDSAAGKGATFAVVIPVDQPPNGE